MSHHEVYNKLDQRFPNWRNEMPPKAISFRRPGKTDLTGVVPAENTTLIEFKTEARVLVLHAVSLQGNQLVDHTAYSGKVWEPLAELAIYRKLRWKVGGDITTSFRQGAWDGETGQECLGTYTVEQGTLSPIVVPPNTTVTLELEPIDLSLGMTISPDGAVLFGYFSGYLIAP